uniref:Uncharacterized protein n=1 Tax=viral metagenome TaxID=1070528 RepID=A0A6H1ZF99_9ZZZZ
MRKIQINKKELEYAYLEEKKTIEMLAKEFNVNKETIWKRLQEFNIPRRKPGLQVGQKLTLYHKKQISKSKKGNRNPAWKVGQ